MIILSKRMFQVSQDLLRYFRLGGRLYWNISGHTNDSIRQIYIRKETLTSKTIGSLCKADGTVGKSFRIALLN